MERIEKKVRNGKRLLTVILILMIIWVIFGPITIINQLLPIPIIMSVMSFAFLILGIVYLRKYRSICLSYRLASRYVKHLELENFYSTDYDLPASKVAFGKEVLYCEKSGTILPYSIVAWVYVHQMNTYGDAILRQLVVKLRNGGNAFLNISDEEIMPLIERLVEKCPDLIIGYGAEQNKQYKK